MTPDAHPILGEVADGVYAACGFSGHGFMQSPAVGRALAEEILGLSPSLDLAPYRLARFQSGADFPENRFLSRPERRQSAACEELLDLAEHVALLVPESSRYAWSADWSRRSSSFVHFDRVVQNDPLGS